MASPSEHKEGLRCGRRDQRYPPWGTVDECPGLLLEHNREQGLGVRCGKKSRTEGVWFDKKGKCREFHPLEVLLSQAAEQNLLSPEQLERIRNAVKEKKSENQGERKVVVKKGEIVGLPNEQVARRVASSEEILDRILKENGSADIMLGGFRDQRIRAQIEKDYRDAGWNVRFLIYMNGPQYVVIIT